MKKKSSLADSYVSALSAALEQRRRELSMSQDELAIRAGLHRTYISLIERKSTNFSIRIFLRLTEALEVNPAEVMRKAENLVNAKKGKQERQQLQSNIDS
jgi:transcriptional regulator with XRE-family HTH domain